MLGSEREKKSITLSFPNTLLVLSEASLSSTRRPTGEKLELYVDNAVLLITLLSDL